MLSTAQWLQYRNVINLASAGFNKDVITWRKFSRGFQRYGEDTVTNEHHDDISLNCLISYNVFRTWPMSNETISGLVDKESIVVILNKDYLKGLGYLNANGFFEMDPGKDIFIHRGIEYRSAGETEVAQAGDDPLMYYIILSREESNTGDDKY